MNILKTLTAALVLSTSLFAAEKIIVGATPVPHAEILEQTKDLLAKEGYELEIKEFNDYVLPNLSTDNGELDANFFQHQPYLDEFNANKGTKLISVAKVHIEPMAVYSKKYKNLNDLKEGALIAVPNDPTNESRALDIIASSKLVSFTNKPLKTPLDITSNPKNLKFQELKAAQLPRVLNSTDIAVINSNYALAAGLNPVKDSIFIESKDSPYVNILVAKPENKDSAKIKALSKALNSEKIRKFIEEKYNGAVIPAF
ncbi:MetQ/NlpA family ABC transporter substrate-binding protein [Campylobacter sp. US33a]|uniref:MetQ/NlpA family ABC transporter substrate-binding protein n=1 Tax=Campylobacter sp. CCS1377 TaxID=3158229 RepID=A0AAU7E4V2_9BACT|nr:MetQ/NlpA family ABC transporter substrate-binding protein [Campylobacter sp. US33a]MCW1360942.1 MetQ/NlpA family ABC transporter substrate-binding protein [Campylobacter jejuni]TEY01604.1 MetQ/NlpA family ABC transporter substrate-binding protein [Campylobacter sp. US33a]